MLKFLESWHGVDKYINKIFYYLKMNLSSLSFDIMLQLPFKTEHKSAIQALQNFKRLKNMDNSLVIENA